MHKMKSSYSEKDGQWVPCASTPCRVHESGDVNLNKKDADGILRRNLSHDYNENIASDMKAWMRELKSACKHAWNVE